MTKPVVGDDEEEVELICAACGKEFVVDEIVAC